MSHYDNRVYLINSIPYPEVRQFLFSLEESPLTLDIDTCQTIKKLFPIPIEHQIIWADCEFDRRCSGIVCTDKGCFIKTNVGVFDTLKRSKRTDNGGKSALHYFRWDIFSPTTFSGTSENNLALRVDPQCQTRFLETCRTFADYIHQQEEYYSQVDAYSFHNYQNTQIGVVQGVAASPNANTAFIQSHIRNTTGRHGFFAEQANNMADRFHGRKATVVGGDNAKNGADRKIDGLFRDTYIQTKYYKTAEGSLNAGFGRDGFYKYIDPSNPSRLMQLEVPSDQYAEVLEGFRQKILEGRVVDGTGRVITDPNEAPKYIRKGSITYEQSVNIAKAGNLDSITYDIRTGVVNCTFAFGISCAVTMLFSYQNNRDMKKALKDGLDAGVKVFGLTMINHVLISQLYRTALFQRFTGNVFVRDMAVSTTLSLAVYSIPNIYNLLCRNISFTQFLKDTAILGGGIFGGALGASGAAAIAKKIGTPFGIVGQVAGGIIGATVGQKIVKTVADIIKEDETDIFMRLLTAIISSMAVEYMLSENEIDTLSNKLRSISESNMKKLMKEYRQSTNQEQTIRAFLEPYFMQTIRSRRKLKRIKEKHIRSALTAISAT